MVTIRKNQAGIQSTNPSAQVDHSRPDLETAELPAESEEPRPLPICPSCGARVFPVGDDVVAELAAVLDGKLELVELGAPTIYLLAHCGLLDGSLSPNDQARTLVKAWREAG